MRFFLFFFLNLVTCSKSIQLSKSRHFVQEEVSCGVPQQTGYVFSNSQDHILDLYEVAACLTDMSDSQVERFLKTCDSNADEEFDEDELFAMMTDDTVPEEKRRATVRMFMKICDTHYNVGATWQPNFCADGFVINNPDKIQSSVECQSDGTWTLASGCIVDVSFIEVGSPGEVDCGAPSFEGYLYWTNNDNQLQPSEWPDTFGEEAFKAVDANEDLIITADELEAAELEVDAFLSQYDVDQTVFGSTKEGECDDGFSGDASSISCLAQGVWSEPSGCAREGTGEIEKKSDAFSAIHSRLNTSTTLSDNSLGKIAEWLAAEFSKTSTSFCWRHSYDRGVGTALHCGGLVQVGLLCYNHCSGSDGVGHNCCRWIPLSCRWHGWSLRCSGGYLHCWFRGGGHGINSCDAGRQNEGGLCYRHPNSGYSCGATVCHKHCDSSLGIVGCGFGACASDSAACAQAVVGMITAPMVMAMNFFTFGSGKGLSTSLNALRASVGKINDCVNAAGLLHASANTFVRALQDFVNLAKKDLGAISPGHTHQSLKGICHVSSLASSSNGNNACVEQIAELWGTKLARSVATAARQADLMAQLEFIDPTGILGVVNAYNKPHCEDANPNYTGPR